MLWRKKVCASCCGWRAAFPICAEVRELLPTVKEARIVSSNSSRAFQSKQQIQLVAQIAEE